MKEFRPEIITLVIAIVVNFFTVSYWFGKVDVKLESDYRRINALEEQVNSLRDVDRSNLVREIENLKK